MEFGAEMQHHIQAKKLFKCPFLINDFAVLSNCFLVSFLNFVSNISNYIAMSFVLHKLELQIVVIPLTLRNFQYHFRNQRPKKHKKNIIVLR